MRRCKPLPLAEMRETWTYDPETGILRDKNDCEVGYPNNIGYRQVWFRGAIYSVHRIVWALHHGRDPIDGEIDHINGDRADNRADNLRFATSAQNNQNRKRSSRNKSGVKGIYFETARRKWVATVGCANNGNLLLFKRFDCFGKAMQAVRDARLQHYGEFARHV